MTKKKIIKKKKLKKTTLYLTDIVLRDLTVLAMHDVCLLVRMSENEEHNFTINLWNYVNKEKYNKVIRNHHGEPETMWGGCCVREALKDTNFNVLDYGIKIYFDDDGASIDFILHIKEEPIGCVNIY